MTPEQVQELRDWYSETWSKHANARVVALCDDWLRQRADLDLLDGDVRSFIEGYKEMERELERALEVVEAARFAVQGPTKNFDPDVTIVYGHHVGQLIRALARYDAGGEDVKP